MDSSVLLWVLCLWRRRRGLRIRRTGRMRVGRRRTILATQRRSKHKESGECGKRENESAGHDWALSAWHCISVARSGNRVQYLCWPELLSDRSRLFLAGARSRLFRWFFFRRLRNKARTVVISEIGPGPFDHHKQAIAKADEKQQVNEQPG